MQHAHCFALFLLIYQTDLNIFQNCLRRELTFQSHQMDRRILFEAFSMHILIKNPSLFKKRISCCWKRKLHIETVNSCGIQTSHIPSWLELFIHFPGNVSPLHTVSRIFNEQLLKQLLALNPLNQSRMTDNNCRTTLVNSINFSSAISPFFKAQHAANASSHRTKM